MHTCMCANAANPRELIYQAILAVIGIPTDGLRLTPFLFIIVATITGHQAFQATVYIYSCRYFALHFHDHGGEITIVILYNFNVLACRKINLHVFLYI